MLSATRTIEAYIPACKRTNSISSKITNNPPKMASTVRLLTWQLIYELTYYAYLEPDHGFPQANKAWITPVIPPFLTTREAPKHGVLEATACPCSLKRSCGSLNVTFLPHARLLGPKFANS